jgi:putative heme-binding domain-containing protein
VGRQDVSVVSQLEALARQSTSPQGRLHALWALEGLGRLRAETVQEALADPSPLVREQAIRLAEEFLAPPGRSDRPNTGERGLQGSGEGHRSSKSPSAVQIRKKLIGMSADPDDRVLFQLVCTLGANVDNPAFRVLMTIALAHIEDPWFQIAALSAAPVSGGAWFQAAINRQDFLTGSSQGREEFLRRIASIVGARQDEREVAALLTAVSRHQTAGDWWRVATLGGLAQGMRRAGQRVPWSRPTQLMLAGLLAASPKVVSAALDVIELSIPLNAPRLRAAIQNSATIVLDHRMPLEVRVNSVRLLGIDRSQGSLALLEQLLAPQQPAEIQKVAAHALGSRGSAAAAQVLVDKWKGLTGPAGEATWNVFLQNTQHLNLLLDAVEAGKLAPFSFNVARVNQLLRHNDDGVRKRAKALFSAVASDRQKIISSYHDAAGRRGDVTRGREVFRRVCSGCHRIGDMGSEAGPDLVNLGGRLTKGFLLTQILDPNANIAAGYEEYVLETTDGRTITGILEEDSVTSVTLRRKEGHQDTVLRSNIARMRASAVSAMPEGHERELNSQQMSDLLEYLQNLGSASTKTAAR